MNILLFILGISIYSYACYLWMRVYFFTAVYIHRNLPKLVSPVALLVWLAFFAAVLIIVFYFPVWLSEKLAIFENSATVTGILILFGGVVLVATLWRGWLSKEGRQFKEAFQGA